MWRLLFFFALVTASALGFAWLADRPGSVDIEWQGNVVHMSLMTMLIGLIGLIAAIMILWWLVKNVLIAPGRFSRSLKQKHREQGIDAVSRGLIAVSAGDAVLARKLAGKAGRKLHSDALATLLKAQAAQLAGDRAGARRLFEAMLESPETEAAGLRGLYLEARREKEMEAARQFAEKAVTRNPQLGWSSQALLEIQSRSGQWREALRTLDLARKHKMLDKKSAERQRAVLLTALALELEEDDADAALTHALEAHRLAPSLVPAANVAGRILAAQGNVRRAANIIHSTWDLAPHPDLALTYAFLRPGDSPRDRLTRVQQLAERTPHNMEGPIALATAAIESHDWKEARHALKTLIAERPTARVCTLMARIEGGEFGDKGRVREWLARAVKAPRDPAWSAEGYVSEHWAPVSPISGRLDAFEWKVPVEGLEYKEDEAFDSFVPLAVEGEEEAALPPAPKAIDVTPAPVLTPAPTAAKPPSPAAPPKATPKATDAGPSEPKPAEPKAAETKAAEAKPAAPKPAESDAAAKADSAAAPAPTAMPDAKTAEPKPVAAKPATPDVETVEAEPLDAPVAFAAAGSGQAATKPAAPAEPQGKSEAARKSEPKPLPREPDIYIAPRLPDDPGPLDTEALPGGDDRLPQRFRQSN